LDVFALVLRARGRVWPGYAAAILLPLLGLLLRLAIGGVVPGAPFFTFFPVVLLVALLGGLLPGALAILLCVILTDYFLLPRDELNVFWPSGVAITVAFISISSTLILVLDFAMRASIRLSDALAQLRASNETLESRIAARTDELMQAEAQLRQAQKMEAVGQLTGGIAHDFNNLLTSMSGSLEVLQRRLAEGRVALAGRYITEVLQAADRAANLTQRLLAFSRRQTLTPRPANLHDIAMGMETLISRAIGLGVTLRIEPAPDLWLALVDAPQMEQALLNLCINAADAMPQGGLLTITAGNHSFDPPAAAALELAAGEYVCLSVTDTGTGMEPGVAAQAFEPFFTTKPLGQGTGLGLSMVYGFLRQSGGQARIESIKGQGTSILLFLPRHDGPADAAPKPAPPPTPAPAAAGATLLLVEDEETLRELAAEILAEQGHTVLQAADGPAGLKLLRATPALDLLITDIGLPGGGLPGGGLPGGMDGRELAAVAREMRPALKIMFITGYSRGGMAGIAPLPDDMRLLTKPFTMKALAAAVANFLAV
jgi:signal transduction histidine kinase/CheY-like chemotaxis protein